MISLGRGLCGKYAESSEREWLETNGRGGYAMGTVAGANTRRYHGLFTVALDPPVNRFQAVNRLQESLFIHDVRYEISCQPYPGVVYPQGYKHLEQFRLDPFPIWTYAVADARLEKAFFLRYGEDTAVVLYHLVSGPEVLLEARPLFSCRGHHGLAKEDGRFENRLETSPRGLRLAPIDGLAVHVASKEGTFSPDSFWYRNQEYVWEERRGMDRREDVFGPGAFQFRLKPGESAALVISTEERDSAEALSWGRQERLLRHQVLERSPARGPLSDSLVLAADQFLVSRGDGASVIAGYPWFEDWSRDAMVSLPGICLAAGRAEDAARVLDVFSREVKDGLLPNRFTEGGPPEYNAVDAPLWFIWAAQKYFQTTKDADRLRRWLPALRAVVDAYQKGAPFGIRMDGDGLIEFPASESALTWMDARVGGRPVTPRSGKPVEIQALWYNALQFLTELGLKFNDVARGYEKLAAIARTSFNEKFWNESARYLYDRLEGRERDPAVRPNALLSISLPYEILEANRFQPVVETAWRELYTTYGLRTLSPHDPAYKGHYGGPPAERDAAYHQGSVWPWLMGPFLTAFGKAYGPSDDTKAQLVKFLQPFLGHLEEAGLGTISELFEGDAPHAAQGCPAQAWSVAELLRVIREENLVI